MLNKVICDTGNSGVFKIGKTGISLSSDPWQGSYENKVCHNEQPLVVGLQSRTDRKQKQTNKFCGAASFLYIHKYPLSGIRDSPILEAIGYQKG